MKIYLILILIFGLTKQLTARHFDRRLMCGYCPKDKPICANNLKTYFGTCQLNCENLATGQKLFKITDSSCDELYKLGLHVNSSGKQSVVYSLLPVVTPASKFRINRKKTDEIRRYFVKLLLNGT